jgi:3-hydroxyanthranilate 3,4-dioxygenase
MSKADTLTPLNFKRWIEENRHLLKPPVGNRQVWEDRDFIVMVIGGPNTRKDYHIDESEEFFYQLEGDMTLKVVDRDGKHRDIAIRAGDIFLLPARVPHCPRRPAGTVGLVVERKRAPGELDGFVWYCEKCGAKLHDEFLHVNDIVKQLPEVFDRFYGDPVRSTCRHCGTRAVK